MTRTTSTRTSALAAGLLVMLALGALGVAQTAFGRSLMADAGLVGDRDRYTQLALAEPKKLPQVIEGGRAELRLPFTLHNDEGEARAYAWSVVARTGGRTRTLARGTTRLAAGAGIRKAPEVEVPCRSRRVRVDVRLAEPAQDVHFFAACEEAPS
jgi:hypothetical protein